MHTVSRRELLASMLALPVLLHADDDWIPLFDGHSLRGWKAAGSTHSFRVKDGRIEAGGPRAHLFYTGPVRQADFQNFELKVEVMPRPGAASGIYFHTSPHSMGKPGKGLKVQVNNTYAGEGDYRERRKTGSLFGIRDIYKALARDNEWSALHVMVRARRVQVWLNGTLVVDYVEPDSPVFEGKEAEPRLGRGTFALESHDANSQVLFRNILVRPLADDLPADAAEQPVVDDVYRDLLRMNEQNFPVVDYHVHLKGGLTLEEALRDSRRLGIQYGIAINGGLGFPTTTDAAAEEFMRSLQGQPVFVALQGEGREWVTLFSKETVAKFDYVFTDAMTFTDDHGKRLRIWIPEEVGDIQDPQQFMEMYVNRILTILNREPIDIHANPTILPEALMADYDRLWTPERMQAVIAAAKKNDIAIEINNHYRVPHVAFLKAAKRAGAKFSFGTNNSDPNLGRMEYAVEMVKECGLTWQDIFVPKPDGEKPVQKRGLPRRAVG
jgi:hypothetical protein